MALSERPTALHDVNEVRNKHKRNEVVKKIKKKKRAEKKVEKEKRQKLLKEQGLPLPKPQTIDSQRTHDETFVSEDDPEVIEDVARIAGIVLIVVVTEPIASRSHASRSHARSSRE